MNEDDTESRLIRVRVSPDIKNDNGLSNSVSTTKYTLISWLPVTIFEEFRRFANVYFLLISILMIVGTYVPEAYVSPLSPWSTLLTLLIVLLITSIKKGVEDLSRARSDKIENSREVRILTFNEEGQAVYTTKKTSQIVAGDIIKMTGHTIVPVDMVMILTSNHNDGNTCYVETTNIDGNGPSRRPSCAHVFSLFTIISPQLFPPVGETNLKVREGLVPSIIKPILEHDGILSQKLFEGSVECESPNRNIHTFVGCLHLEALKEPIVLSHSHLLLRSCVFSNTDWGYGVAVYTGKESKVLMNSRLVSYKVSKIEGYANVAVGVVFILQLVLVSLAVAGLYAEKFYHLHHYPYIYPTGVYVVILTLTLTIHITLSLPLPLSLLLLNCSLYMMYISCHQGE